jgi:16S rRNA (guanine(966)-N(2))-methyltransferase RsmD
MRIIAGEARGRRLFGPKDRSVRPPLDSIREALFSLLDLPLAGRTVLDLFAGTGSFGLEAVSRGARRAVFVESAPRVLTVLRRNMEVTGFAARCEVLAGSAFILPDLTVRPPGEYSVAFVDPPFPWFREPAKAEAVLQRVGELVTSPVLSADGRVFLRCPPDFLRQRAVPHARVRTYRASAIVEFSKTEPFP